ncbi:MAG TPA: VOC family protein, partial [Clostridiales bacterium]|nr:VOC family protein [Clostridiales bacterium]
MAVRGIHHIAMKVSDYDRSVCFYRDGLGFSLVNQWGEPGNRACMLDAGEGDHVE